MKRTTNSITVYVNGWDKVEDLKQKIIGKMGIESKTEIGSDLKRLTLKYGQNDDYDILNDKKTINDYPIKKDDIVHLSIDEFEIVVQYEKEEKTYNVWLKREENVAILKKKITNEINGWIESDDQILKMDRNGDDGTVTVLEDGKTMTNYGIGKGATVLLFSEFEIVVKYKKDNDEKTVTVQTKGTDTVAKLKKKIKKKIKDDFPLIEYGSIVIKDHPRSDYDKNLHGNYSSKTLKECGIGEGATIYLVSGWVVDPEYKYIERKVELM
ncbi:hypothetical protein niasHT_024787 [Heterodera trifolii]|uniref:Ubiquitin-like domain-containing protein n=1 Tax=Heterodera trifolii TaxID=157864 RepID=A0ABD2JH09_9BILA